MVPTLAQRLCDRKERKDAATAMKHAVSDMAVTRCSRTALYPRLDVLVSHLRGQRHDVPEPQTVATVKGLTSVASQSTRRSRQPL